jgi:hypothetical protein
MPGSQSEKREAAYGRLPFCLLDLSEFISIFCQPQVVGRDDETSQVCCESKT